MRTLRSYAIVRPFISGLTAGVVRRTGSKGRLLMKLAAAIAIVSTSLLGCTAAPEPEPVTEGESKLVAATRPTTTECQLRYEYKDCAHTVCQLFVDDFKLGSS